MIKTSDLKKVIEFLESNKIENLVIIPEGLDMVTQFGNMKLNLKFQSPEMIEKNLVCVRLGLSHQAPHDAIIEIVKTERI